MLLELTVSNFAVIEKLHLSLQPGLTVLTGETGAGKSLLMDALTALLGGRVGPEVIRTGASNARIEGVFQAPSEDASLAALLSEYGLESEEEVLIITREVSDRGRTLARINGRTAPLALLRQVGASLVDIHGQSEHLSLLDRRRHLDFLDAFGGLMAERQELAFGVAELRKLHQELEKLESQEAEAMRHLELLRFQVEEIQAARLQPGEEETLLHEREVLANAQHLQEWSLSAYQALSWAEGASAVDLVEQAKASLKTAALVDPELQSYLTSLEEASIALEDASRGLRSYADAIEFNPARQAEVEERLELLAHLRRKYGSTVAEVLAYAQRGEEELAREESKEERRAALQQSIADLEESLGQLAHQLSERRQKALQRLETAVGHELEELHMEHVRFAVRLEQQMTPEGLPLPDGRRYTLTTTGVDQVEFLLSANPGEELRPLAQVASGGETSRLMLALKSALQGADAVPTLVFDELEMGVGGRGGEVVGKKLWALARGRQVLCVTHLPQIACYGDAHLRVAKEVLLDKTFTQVDVLEGEARLDELTAMLGGASQRLYDSAQELLSHAHSWKAKQGDS